MPSAKVRCTALGATALTALATFAVVAPASASPSYPIICASAQVDAPRNQVTTFSLSCEDEQGNPVDEYVVLTQPTKAQTFAVDAATGEVTYEPEAGADGTDGFTFKGVIDGLGESAATDAVITLGNERPVCEPVADVSVVHDTSVVVPLVCTDADGDQLTVATGTVGAEHGTVTVDEGVTYAPAAGYVGTDTFSLRATDGSLYSEEVTVAVTVTNARPTCTGADVKIVHDRAKSFALTCTDADGDALTGSVAAQAQHGTVTISGAQLTYTPAAGYLGSDTFTVTATDGIQAAVPARIDVSVTNKAPTCTAKQSLVTRARRAVPVRISCKDKDGDAVKVVVKERPDHGKLVREDGRWFYVADKGFRGRDSFKLAGSDGVSLGKAVAFTVKVKRG